MNRLPPAERLARLRLARTDGVGPVGFAQLLALHGTALTAVDALTQARRAVPEIATVEAEMAAAEAAGARHVFEGEADYPPLLAQLSDPPPVLLMKGDARLAARPVVGLVGARNASAAGRALAFELAQALGEAGWVVVSGLARGIDAAAHQGALSSGTIACVAGGVDIAYPPENAALQAEIGADGLILSEFPVGTEPLARHFPRRNRLIAGVSQGLIVIEAALGSGSLITARLAGEAGREVMAVPGHPRDPRSSGGNNLIRQGAHLVETVADVLAALAPFALTAEPRRPAPPRRTRPTAVSKAAPMPAGSSGLIALLSVSGIAIDEVVRASGLPAASVQAALADLELEGQVVRLAGGRVARVG